MMAKNVSEVVENGLCTSCGICAGCCNYNAISFYYGSERNTPQVDLSKCVSCGLCYEVCPGKGIALKSISKKLFEDELGVKKNLYAGYYLNTYIGHSTNENIRYHSATGGMVTQFLIYLLKQKIIDGAVVVRYNKDNVFEPEPFIATTEDEIWNSRSSKYVVVSMDKIVSEIVHSNKKKLVVVGLPCHIQGWRQLAKKNKRVRDAIIGYFAIYCSLNKTKLSLDYYPIRYKVDKNNVGKFSFRDDGCMGFMKFSDKHGNVLKKIPYLDYWFGTHSFFANPRCSLCIDQLGELADISFGDIHIEPYSTDEIGTNSIITRSVYWDEILNDCKIHGYVFLEKIPIDILIKSQLYVKWFKKGAGVKANFLFKRVFGKPVPIYDYTYSEAVGIKCLLVEICKALMRKIGSHKKLWFIIKMLDKNKN